MTSKKFPDYPNLNANYSDQFPRLKGKYVGSLHKKFIKSIVVVKCSSIGCDKSLIDDDSSPIMTGYCGHLFCSGCAQELFNKYNEERRGRKKDAKEDKGIYPPQEEMKEVYYSSSDSNHHLYKCGKCPQSVVKARQGDTQFGYLKLFSANRMVENLYNALKKEEGYFCGHPMCREWHPKNNSLFCTECNDKKGDKFRHVCVWHADEHLTHDLKIMDHVNSNASLNAFFKPKQVPDDERLSSVDRNDLRVIASFYHCAFCRQSLGNDDEEHARASQLECGHFVGHVCNIAVLEKVNVKRHVHCFFCNDKVHLEVASQKYFMFPCTQLADIVKNAPHKLVNCNIGGCSKMHPQEADEKACMCCTVEKGLKDWKNLAKQHEAFENIV